MIKYIKHINEERNDLMLRMHKANQRTNLSTVAIAAFVGGLAGAVVGLMFAPKSGKELRLGIYKKADNAREHVEDVTSLHAETLKQQRIDLVDKGKKIAEDLQTFIQESLKIRNSDNIPINIDKDTPTEEPLQHKPEMDLLAMDSEKGPLSMDSEKGPLAMGSEKGPLAMDSKRVPSRRLL